MALKDFDGENKFMPLLEWKFYSNLIKTHPYQFFSCPRGNVPFLSHPSEGIRGPEQSGPRQQEGSGQLLKDSQMIRTKHAKFRAGAGIGNLSLLISNSPSSPNSWMSEQVT